MAHIKLSPSEKWIILGIPGILIIGSLIHSLYEWSGNHLLVGFIAPVNESPWEHLKLLLIPIIFWWTLYYMVKSKSNNINFDKWFSAALISLLTAIITILFLYFFYSGAFGVELVVVDICIFFLSIIFGQLLGLNCYRNLKKGIGFSSIIFMIIIIIMFIILTLDTPKLPLFFDKNTGQYGIGFF